MKPPWPKPLLLLPSGHFIEIVLHSKYQHRLKTGIGKASAHTIIFTFPNNRFKKPVLTKF